jgi:hypothetical protein
MSNLWQSEDKMQALDLDEVVYWRYYMSNDPERSTIQVVVAGYLLSLKDKEAEEVHDLLLKKQRKALLKEQKKVLLKG